MTPLSPLRVHVSWTGLYSAVNASTTGESRHADDVDVVMGETRVISTKDLEHEGNVDEKIVRTNLEQKKKLLANVPEQSAVEKSGAEDDDDESHVRKNSGVLDDPDGLNDEGNLNEKIAKTKLEQKKKLLANVPEQLVVEKSGADDDDERHVRYVAGVVNDFNLNEGKGSEKSEKIAKTNLEQKKKLLAEVPEQSVMEKNDADDDNESYARNDAGVVGVHDGLNEAGGKEKSEGEGNLFEEIVRTNLEQKKKLLANVPEQSTVEKNNADDDNKSHVRNDAGVVEDPNNLNEGNGKEKLEREGNFDEKIVKKNETNVKKSKVENELLGNEEKFNKNVEESQQGNDNIIAERGNVNLYNLKENVSVLVQGIAKDLIDVKNPQSLNIAKESNDFGKNQGIANITNNIIENTADDQREPDDLSKWNTFKNLDDESHHVAAQRIRILCLRHGEECSDGEEGLHETEVGLLSDVDLQAPLTHIRLQIHRRIDVDAVPIKFHFLKENASIDKSRFLESVPWLQESTTTLMDCLGKPSFGDGEYPLLHVCSPWTGSSRGSIPGLVRATRGAFGGGAAAAPALTTLEQWQMERKSLLMEIQQLEAKLAEARHQNTETSQAKSMLRRSLLQLRNEEFVTKDVDDLEKEYLQVFTLKDAESAFASSQSSPLKPAYRRLANEPKKLRTYIECLEKILVKYKIRTNRLTSYYWTAILVDPRFIQNPDLFDEWAKHETWRMDDAERSAYLGSLVLADESRMDEYMLLKDPEPQVVAAMNPDDLANESQRRKSDDSLQASAALDRKSIIEHSASQRHVRAVLRHDSTGSIEIHEACDDFRIDLLASQFGLCVCGFPKLEHKGHQENFSRDDHRVGGGAPPHAKPRPSVSACEMYVIDPAGARFGACLCGHDRTEHVLQHGELIAAAHATFKAPRPSKNACENYEMDPQAVRYGVCLCGHDKTEHDLATKRTGQQPELRCSDSNVAPGRVAALPGSSALLPLYAQPRRGGDTHNPRPSALSCDHYEINSQAARYGVCLCGHDKLEHRKVYTASGSMGDLKAPISLEATVTNTDDKFVTSMDRSKRAKLWVEQEIKRLKIVIMRVGTKEQDGSYSVHFGKLFREYELISDALVGILSRARRRGIVYHNGPMGDLLQSPKHDEVVIFLNAQAAEQV